MDDFFNTRRGRDFVDGTMPRLARAIEALNQSMTGLNARLDVNQERDKEYVDLARKAQADNDQWLAGQVKLDPKTHTALLEEARKLCGLFEAWIKFQTSPTVLVPDQPKLYDEEENELCTKCGLLMSYHTPTMPPGGECEAARVASDENNDPQAYDNRARPTFKPEWADLLRILQAKLLNAGPVDDGPVYVEEADLLGDVADYLDDGSLRKTPNERILDQFSETMTAAVNANEAQQMADELEHLLFFTHERSVTPDESVLNAVYALAKKWGYGKKKEDDECPNCKNGTLERNGDELVCRGECGEIFHG